MIISVPRKAFYQLITAESAEVGYLLRDLFTLQDVAQFPKPERKKLSVELWVDEQNDINVRLVSDSEYVQVATLESGEIAIDAVIQRFDTAKNCFVIPSWMVEMTSRESSQEGLRFAVGTYDSNDPYGGSEPGVVGQIKLLRRV